MDILSHGLWGIAAAKGVNLKIKNENKINFKAAVFWGFFPDLFAFTVPFTLALFNAIFKIGEEFNLPKPEQIEPMARDGQITFVIANFLYNISHSIIVFIFVFAIIFFFFKKTNFSMLAWLLHIFMDIPTHSYKFFPTPVLWPVSEWRFKYGFSWANIWFEAINYGLLIAIFIFLKIKQKQNIFRANNKMS